MIGTYKAKAKEWGLGYSQVGNEQIAVLFEITQGEHAGKTYTWYGHFTEKTLERTLDSLRHCGWDSDSLAELDNLGANEVEIVLEEENDQEGKQRTRVRWVNRSSRLALREQLGQGDVQAFAAKMRGKTIAHKRTYGKPAANPPSQPRAQRGFDEGREAGDPGPQDSDVPF